MAQASFNNSNVGSSGEFDDDTAEYVDLDPELANDFLGQDEVEKIKDAKKPHKGGKDRYGYDPSNNNKSPTLPVKMKKEVRNAKDGGNKKNNSHSNNNGRRNSDGGFQTDGLLFGDKNTAKNKKSNNSSANNRQEHPNAVPNNLDDSNSDDEDDDDENWLEDTEGVAIKPHHYADVDEARRRERSLHSMSVNSQISSVNTEDDDYLTGNKARNNNQHGDSLIDLGEGNTNKKKPVFKKPNPALDSASTFSDDEDFGVNSRNDSDSDSDNNNSRFTTGKKKVVKDDLTRDDSGSDSSDDYENNNKRRTNNNNNKHQKTQVHHSSSSGTISNTSGGSNSTKDSSGNFGLEGIDRDGGALNMFDNNNDDDGQTNKGKRDPLEMSLTSMNSDDENGNQVNSNQKYRHNNGKQRGSKKKDEEGCSCVIQ